MTKLSQKTCSQGKNNTPPLPEEEVKKLYNQLQKGWGIEENHHLEKEFSFPNYKDTVFFVMHVANIAEEQNHHPDIFFSWGKAKITLFTHKIDGLSENDFILADKIDDAFSQNFEGDQSGEEKAQ